MMKSTASHADIMNVAPYRVFESHAISHTHSINSNGRPFELFNLGGVAFLSP